MYVTVDAASGALALVEGDDFTAFHVVALPRDAAEHEVGAALGSDGGAAGDDHVWVTVEAVQRLAVPGLADADAVVAWRSGFEKMLAYAHENGWMNDDRSCIRAHISRA